MNHEDQVNLIQDIASRLSLIESWKADKQRQQITLPLDDASVRLLNEKIILVTANATPLSGTKVYYVSDSSGGAVTRKLTFTNGILVAET